MILFAKLISKFCDKSSNTSMILTSRERAVEVPRLLIAQCNGFRLIYCSQILEWIILKLNPPFPVRVPHYLVKKATRGQHKSPTVRLFVFSGNSRAFT